MVLLVLPWARTINGVVTASVFVNVGMWLKRFIIVVPTLASPFMPPSTGSIRVYSPTWVEWAITAGAFAAFCLMFSLFAKVFPIISMWEVSGPASETHTDSARLPVSIPSVPAAGGGIA
jgi:molybdopterin-containing oxidoreductase family membrane subunit